jgi:hypothetical protein
MGRRELMNESVKRKRSLKTALCMGLIRLFRPHPSPSGTARDLGEAIRAAGTSRRRGAVLRSIDRFVDLACGLKQRCTPNMPARKILRSIHEGARDLARDLALTDGTLGPRSAPRLPEAGVPLGTSGRTPLDPLGRQLRPELRTVQSSPARPSGLMAPSHSSTSSARARSDSGNFMPRYTAVRSFSTNSNLVGRSTGRRCADA